MKSTPSLSPETLTALVARFRGRPVAVLGDLVCDEFVQGDIARVSREAPVLILEHSHTCYEGDRSHRHDWGYGCGRCPACEQRARGWREWRNSS